MECTPRLMWPKLPQALREDIEHRLGGPVVSVEPVVGGFSAGFAGVIRTAQGSTFVKATSAAINEHGRFLYRREHQVCKQLADSGHKVGLQWSLEWQDWTALGFEAIDGRIYDSAWGSERDLHDVLTMLLDRRVRAPAGFPALQQVLEDLFGAWEALADDTTFDAWPAGPDGRPILAPQDWCALASRARKAFAGHDLLHADLRADNILRTVAGPVVVDWAYACRGHAAFDPIYLLLEVARMRGRAPTSALDRVLQDYLCDPHDASALLAAFDGWFTWMSRQPHVSALPELRTFQAEMALAARTWCLSRLTAPSISRSRPTATELAARATEDSAR